jgi:hypothetical protein
VRGRDVGHQGTGTAAGDRQLLGAQQFVRAEHRIARQSERACQRPRRRQRAAGEEAAVEYRALQGARELFIQGTLPIQR